MPIETENQQNQYAPFHCLGKDLVLFNKNDAYGIGEIRTIP